MAGLRAAALHSTEAQRRDCPAGSSGTDFAAFSVLWVSQAAEALARQQITVGEYRVRRLLCQLGMTRSVGKVRVRTTDSNHPHPRYPNRIKGLKLTRPDQVWVADITLFVWDGVSLLGGDFGCLYAHGARLGASRTIDPATLDALDRRGYSDPLIFHSDQGAYAAWNHTQRLLKEEVLISMSAQPKMVGRALYANGEGGTCRL